MRSSSCWNSSACQPIGPSRRRAALNRTVRMISAEGQAAEGEIRQRVIEFIAAGSSDLTEELSAFREVQTPNFGKRPPQPARE